MYGGEQQQKIEKYTQAILVVPLLKNTCNDEIREPIYTHFSFIHVETVHETQISNAFMKYSCGIECYIYMFHSFNVNYNAFSIRIIHHCVGDFVELNYFQCVCVII